VAADDLGALEKLTDEKVSSAALTKTDKGLLWRATWQALQLPYAMPQKHTLEIDPSGDQLQSRSG